MKAKLNNSQKVRLEKSADLFSKNYSAVMKKLSER